MSSEKIIFAVITIILFFKIVIFEPNSLDVTKYTIKNRDLSGIKIVFISDLHLKKSEYKRIDKVIKLTNNENPDLIIFGGDYLADKNPKKSMDIEKIADKMTLLNAPIVSVLGEGDWEADGMQIAKALQKNRVKVLENSSYRLYKKGHYIDIVGLADQTKRTVKIPKAVRFTKKPRILVTHNPDVYFSVMDEFDLILAGHTHGGKMIIPFTPALMTNSKYKFTSGQLKPGRNEMIITKGVGTTGLPVRFNCKPEIVVIEFQK